MSSNPVRPFTYRALPSRVVFGAGSLARLADEIEALGARGAGVEPPAVMHVPIETAREARAEATRLGADCAVAIGGGSTTGLGKAIALLGESGDDLPIVAIPTTYAGSEMTPIYGLTEGGVKRTGRDPRVLPRTVIYDPALTTSLPWQMSVTSGINAIAHAAEGLYAQDANPVTSLMAEEGIRALAQGLARLDGQLGDMDARSDCLYGAWLCGSVLGAVGMALHHKLCHTLGGSFDLPHAQTHTIVLPHALAYNASAVPEAMQRIARALSAPSAPRGVFDLARDHGAPTALRDIGMKEDDLDRAADLATTNAYWNPRPIDREPIRELLQRAFEGTPPG